MALNIIALALVLGITFMHSIFGFYSGIINVFCTIVAAVIAFGFFEALTGFVAQTFELHTAYVGPASLVLLFVISLVALRLAADQLIRGNVNLPRWLDWGGAGLCGFVNAQIITGILVLGLLMLPLTGKVLGFERLTRHPDLHDPDHNELARFDRASLWTKSDEFTVGLFNIISNGSMKGSTPFKTVYPDFVDAVYYSGNTIQPESSPAAFRSKKDGDGFKKGLQVESWWLQTQPLDVKYRRGVPGPKNRQPAYTKLKDGFQAAPGNKLIGIRARLKPAAADRSGNSAMHLFRPTMLRLVGTVGDAPQHYIPRVIGNADTLIPGEKRLVDPDNNFALKDLDAEIELYYEVDQRFEPSFLEYRRYARASLAMPPAETAPTGELKPTQAVTRARNKQQSGLTFGRIAAANSGQSDRMPLEFAVAALKRRGDVELAGDTFVKGRFFGETSRFKGGGQKVERIQEPPGKRIVQIRYNPKDAKTLAGQVFNFVGQLNQFHVTDNRGNDHPMVGYFAVVKRRGKEYIEFFFNGDGDDLFDPSYAAFLDFKNLKQQEINDQDDTEMGLYFLVPAGVTVTRIGIHTGGGADIKIETRP